MIPIHDELKTKIIEIDRKLQEIFQQNITHEMKIKLFEQKLKEFNEIDNSFGSEFTLLRSNTNEKGEFFVEKLDEGQDWEVQFYCKKIEHCNEIIEQLIANNPTKFKLYEADFKSYSKKNQLDLLIIFCFFVSLIIICYSIGYFIAKHRYNHPPAIEIST